MIEEIRRVVQNLFFPPKKAFFVILISTLHQCFSTAGLRPGTGPWHQLYRAARGLSKLQYATRFH